MTAQCTHICHRVENDHPTAFTFTSFLQKPLPYCRLIYCHHTITTPGWNNSGIVFLSPAPLEKKTLGSSVNGSVTQTFQVGGSSVFMCRGGVVQGRFVGWYVRKSITDHKFATPTLTKLESKRNTLALLVPKRISMQVIN